MRRDIFNFMNDMEKVIESVAGEVLPRNNKMRSDIKDLGNEYVVEVELPGFEKENIGISYEDEFLKISAEFRKNEETENVVYLHKERYIESVSRGFTISNVDAENIKANYINGVLIVNLPKKEKPISKININID